MTDCCFTFFCVRCYVYPVFVLCCRHPSLLNCCVCMLSQCFLLMVNIWHFWQKKKRKEKPCSVSLLSILSVSCSLLTLVDLSFRYVFNNLKIAEMVPWLIKCSIKDRCSLTCGTLRTPVEKLLYFHFLYQSSCLHRIFLCDPCIYSPSLTLCQKLFCPPVNLSLCLSTCVFVCVCLASCLSACVLVCVCVWASALSVFPPL